MNRLDRQYKINKVDIIFDTSIYVIYINDGECVFTTRIYSSKPSIEVKGSYAKIGEIKSIVLNKANALVVYVKAKETFLGY